MQMAREVEPVLLAELGSGGGVTDVARAADMVPGTGVTAAAVTVAPRLRLRPAAATALEVKAEAAAKALVA